MSTQVIISRFNEKSSWLEDVPANIPLRIYDKGEPLRSFTDHLPNRGREAETYLHHIVTYYDHLADWTVFTQGDPVPHLSGWDFADLLTPQPGCLLVPRIVASCEWGEGGHLRWDKYPQWAARFASGEIRPAKLDFVTWCREYLGVTVTAAEGVSYGPGAIFGVSREVIHNRPLSFYRRLLETVSDHVHPEEAHYLERAWPLVFGVPCRALYARNAPPPAPIAFPADIFGWLSEAEGRALAALAAGRTVLEVGTYYGRSAACMAQTAEKVYCLDWHRGDPGAGSNWTLPQCAANLRAKGLEDKVVHLVGRLEDVSPVLGCARFGLVFLDGEHTYEATRAAFGPALMAIKPGGIIALHDFDYPEVHRAAFDFFGHPAAGRIDRLAWFTID